MQRVCVLCTSSLTVRLITLCGLCRNWWMKYRLAIKCRARNDSPSASQVFKTHRHVGGGRNRHLVPLFSTVNIHVLTLKYYNWWRSCENSQRNTSSDLLNFCCPELWRKCKTDCMLNCGIVLIKLLFIGQKMRVCIWFLWSFLPVQQEKGSRRWGYFYKRNKKM